MRETATSTSRINEETSKDTFALARTGQPLNKTSSAVEARKNRKAILQQKRETATNTSRINEVTFKDPFAQARKCRKDILERKRTNSRNTSNGRSLTDYDTMPHPDNNLIHFEENRLIDDETTAYNVTSLRTEHQQLYSALTDEQRTVYDTIMDDVNTNKGGVYFLYGYGGTGKTFVWKTLAAAIRSKREIVLNVASSGIAALLLEGGRTAHSRFAILINVNETSFCCICPDSDSADLIRKTKLNT